jgi:DNA-binding Xre family transcriptional regulator
MQLKEYLEKKGIKQVSLARQIGISETTLVSYFAYGKPIAYRYWLKIIEITNGEVSLYDLMLTHAKDFEDFELKARGTSCVISLKKKNK